MLSIYNLSLPVIHHPHQYVSTQQCVPSLYTSWRPCTLHCKPLRTLNWCILGVWHVIGCQMMHKCRVGITMRHNDNVNILRWLCFCFHCNLQPNCTCVVAHWILDLHITMTVMAQMPSWFHITSNPVICIIQQFKLQDNVTVCNVPLFPCH